MVSATKNIYLKFYFLTTEKSVVFFIIVKPIQNKYSLIFFDIVIMAYQNRAIR